MYIQLLNENTKKIVARLSLHTTSWICAMSDKNILICWLWLRCSERITAVAWHGVPVPPYWRSLLWLSDVSFFLSQPRAFFFSWYCHFCWSTLLCLLRRENWTNLEKLCVAVIRRSHRPFLFMNILQQCFIKLILCVATFYSFACTSVGLWSLHTCY